MCNLTSKDPFLIVFTEMQKTVKKCFRDQASEITVIIYKYYVVINYGMTWYDRLHFLVWIHLVIDGVSTEYTYNTTIKMGTWYTKEQIVAHFCKPCVFQSRKSFVVLSRVKQLHGCHFSFIFIKIVRITYNFDAANYLVFVLFWVN